MGAMLSSVSSLFGGSDYSSLVTSSTSSLTVYAYSAAANSLTNSTNAAAMVQTAQINADYTQMTMAAEKEKSEWNKWKLLQDTQNKIYEIQQEVTVSKAKTQDKMFNKWDDYIKS